MMKTNLKVKVIDIHTKECLFECSVEDTEKAFVYAASLEEMGLAVEVITPNIADTFSFLVNRKGGDSDNGEEDEECKDGSCASTYSSIDRDKHKLD